MPNASGIGAVVQALPNQGFIDFGYTSPKQRKLSTAADMTPAMLSYKSDAQISVGYPPGPFQLLWLKHLENLSRPINSRVPPTTLRENTCHVDIPTNIPVTSSLHHKFTSEESLPASSEVSPLARPELAKRPVKRV